MMFRVGLGQDSHEFVTDEENKSLMLGGVRVSGKGGLKGNSDGDAILHSICNALSSAIGGDSLSTWADDLCNQGIKDSARYVEDVFNKIVALKYSVANISISVEARKPRLKMEVVDRIKIKIASLLKIEVQQVGLTFTSGEGLTSFGLGKGIQALTIVNIIKHD
jgi:2-C-methyl-D-erythritol 2,4-cyclodiphosphate synthase